MLLFLLFFASLLTGAIYSGIKIFKEKQIDLLKIVSLINIVFVIIIFVTAK